MNLATDIPKRVNERWRTRDARDRAHSELDEVMDFLEDLSEGGRKKLATFMGSARVQSESLLYRHAFEQGRVLAEHGVVPISGGGTGIMEASNRGSRTGGGLSVGISSAVLAGEQVEGDLYDAQLKLAMFFNRRYAMLTVADVISMYEGGFGTLNEGSEALMLMQMEIVDRVPLFFIEQGRSSIFGLFRQKGYWTELFTWMKNYLLQPGYIHSSDLQIGQIVDARSVSGPALARLSLEQIGLRV
jgi:uncharacterized protein (TIGR00730 family)